MNHAFCLQSYVQYRASQKPRKVSYPFRDCWDICVPATEKNSVDDVSSSAINTCKKTEKKLKLIRMFVVSSWCSKASHFCTEFGVKSDVLQQSFTLVTLLMFIGKKYFFILFYKSLLGNMCPRLINVRMPNRTPVSQ